MNDWLDGERDDHIQQYEQDIEEITRRFFILYEECEGQPPATFVETLIQDICRFRVFDRPLPSKAKARQLALCDFGNKMIMVNSNMRRFVPKKSLLIVRHSTLAHELGHIRLHQDEVTERSFISMLGDFQCDDPRALQKENEANLYAALFLLPENLLREVPDIRRMLRFRARSRTLRSSTIWQKLYRTAHRFQVSVTLTKRRFMDLGWIEETGEKKSDVPVLRLNYPPQ